MSVETTAVVAVTSPRSTATDRHMFLLIGVPALLSLVVTGVTGFVANPPTSSAAAGSHGDNSSTRQWRQPLRTVINTPTHATGTSATSEAMPTATGTTTSEAYLPGDLGGTQQFQRFSEFLLETQREICLQAEMADRGPIGDDGEKAGGSTFCYDSWKRDAPTKVRALVSSTIHLRRFFVSTTSVLAPESVLTVATLKMEMKRRQ